MITGYAIRAEENVVIISRLKTDIRYLNLRELEALYVNSVYEFVTNGNMTHAAKILGIDRRTIYRKISKSKRILKEKEIPTLAP